MSSLPKHERTPNISRDAQFYTAEALGKRASLRDLPAIRGKYLLWWNTVLELFDDNHDGSLQKDEYLAFYGALHSVLLGDGEEEDDPDNWRKSAEEDWNRDIRDTHNADGSSPNQGEASMDQDHFIRSLHELVDLWTVTTNAEEYLDFIDYTLTRVCEISPQTKFSFWTRAVQRLQLPRFLKLKLGPDGDDSQTPGNDGQLPESVAHILDSGSFSSSTLDELRFEFHRAAPDGMLDLDGFKRVLVRLGYKGMANDGGSDEDTEKEARLLEQAFLMFTQTAPSCDKGKDRHTATTPDNLKRAFDWPLFVQCMCVVSKEGGVDHLLEELFNLYEGPCCKTQFDHLVTARLAHELVMTTPSTIATRISEPSVGSNLTAHSTSLTLEQTESTPFPVEVMPWGEVFTEPTMKTAMSVADSIDAASLQRSSVASMGNLETTEDEVDRMRRRSRSNSRILGIEFGENALSSVGDALPDILVPPPHLLHAIGDQPNKLMKPTPSSHPSTNAARRGNGAGGSMKCDVTPVTTARENLPRPSSSRPYASPHSPSSNRKVLRAAVFDIASVAKRGGAFPNSEKSLQERAVQLEKLRLQRLEDEHAWVRRWTRVLQQHIVRSESAPFACTHQLKEHGFTTVQGQSGKSPLIEPHDHSHDPLHLVCTLESRSLRGIGKRMQAQYRALQEERRRHGLPSFTTPNIFGRRYAKRHKKEHNKQKRRTKKGRNRNRMEGGEGGDDEGNMTKRPRSVGDVSPWTSSRADSSGVGESSSLIPTSGESEGGGKSDSGVAVEQIQQQPLQGVRQEGKDGAQIQNCVDDLHGREEVREGGGGGTGKGKKKKKTLRASTRMSERKRMTKLSASIEVNALPTIPHVQYRHAMPSASGAEESAPARSKILAGSASSLGSETSILGDSSRNGESSSVLGMDGSLSGPPSSPIATSVSLRGHSVSPEAEMALLLTQNDQLSDYSIDDGSVVDVVVARARNISTREGHVPEDANPWMNLEKKISESLAPKLHAPFFQGGTQNTTLHKHSLRASMSDSQFGARSRLTPRLKTPIYGAADRQRQRATTPGLSHRQLSSIERLPHRSLISAQSSRESLSRGRPICTPDPAQKMLSHYRVHKILNSASVFHMLGERVQLAGLRLRQKRKRKLVGGFGLLPSVEVGDPNLRLVQDF